MKSDKVIILGENTISKSLSNQYDKDTIIKNNKRIYSHEINTNDLEITVNSYHYAGITPELLSAKLIINTLSDDNLVEGFESKCGHIFGFQYHIERHPELFFIIKEIIDY